MRLTSMVCRPALTAGVLAVFLGTATPSTAEWRRIDSPNFVVVGDVSERTLRGVAVQFEGFRETLTRVLTERATATPVPTLVIVFPSDRAFTPFKPTYQGKPVPISGLFVGRRDANYIAMVADGGQADGLQIVFHEYAHLVVSNVFRNVPAWLNEGLAEFYSTYDVGDGGREAVLGRPIGHHLERLQNTQLLKLNDLLNVDHESPFYNERDRQSVFYAQSWALTHKILMGEPRRTAELSAYLQLVSEGTPPLQAWQKAFAAADLDRELQDYIRRRLFKAVQYTFPDKLAKFDAPATILSAADAEAYLSEFLIRQERDDEAAARLAPAVKRDPDNVRLKLVLGLLDVERDAYDNAAKRLLTIEPADWLAAYSAAMALVAMAEGRGEAAGAEHVQAVRRLVGVASQQRPEIPNALAQLATMEVRSAGGPTKETLRTIERARLMAPGREDYAFVHAQVLARLADFAAARAVVGPLMTPAQPPQIRDAARSLMSYILQLQRAAQAAGDRTTGPGGTSPQLGDNPVAPRPSSLTPVFRALKTGEQRLEGELERIECRAGGAAVFHLRTAGGPASATAASMADVDFITYRNDLSGSIPCGPLKTALPVYLSWRAGNGSPDEKVAIAIEFLPE
jgi:tetratricopeptide (TPR) repeat protein